MGRRAKSREQLIENAVSCFVDHPFEQLSLQGVADACGESLWALRHHFDNVDGMFRAIASHLLAAVASAAEYEAPASSSVVDAIDRYARFLADLVQSTDYRRLLYFIVRNGRHHNWLGAAYESNIVAKVCRNLEEAIWQAGNQHGVVVLLKNGAARRFHRRIESEFALSDLLPTPDLEAASELQDQLKDIVREAYSASYVFNWQAASAA